jgi:hypothetical protein
MDAKVQAHLQEMRRATEKRATVTKAHVIDELGIVALSDIGEVFTQSVDGRYITVRSLDDLSHAARRCIKSIRQTTHEQQDAEGRFVEKVQIQVELHPKVQALDLLMAHFGLKQAEKIDVHVNVASAKVRLAEKLNDLRERNQPQPDEPGGETGA